jgi:hypothetical protein
LQLLPKHETTKTFILIGATPLLYTYYTLSHWFLATTDLNCVNDLIRGVYAMLGSLCFMAIVELITISSEGRDKLKMAILNWVILWGVHITFYAQL